MQMGRATLIRLAFAIVLLIGINAITLPISSTAALPGRNALIATAAAESPQIEWQRLNYGSPPGHERMRCHRVEDGALGINAAAEDSAWVCRYDQVPEAALNFGWSATFATFGGVDVTRNWVCPPWLSSQTCARVARVIDGVFVYTPMPSGTGFTQREQLLLSNDGNMTLIWVDFGFACPWFQSFSMALEANPFPLPFDGVHGPNPDCVFRT
jgi:hypothetical protein